MGDFSGTVLTNRGRNLLAKAQTGITLQFTRIGIGDGVWPTGQDPTGLLSLISEKKSLPIQTLEVTGDGTSRLRFVLTNIGLTAGFFIREIGIFANDPDLGEILYAVTYASDKADYIPAAGVTLIENVTDIFTVVANAQSITAVISDTVVIATKKDIQNHDVSATSHQGMKTDLQNHLTNQGIHQNYISHAQTESLNIWKIIHNLNTTRVPVVKAYSEKTEQIYLTGYCGDGTYCGDGNDTVGNPVDVSVYEEIQPQKIKLTTQNSLSIIFATPQAGRAVIII